MVIILIILTINNPCPPLKIRSLYEYPHYRHRRPQVETNNSTCTKVVLLKRVYNKVATAFLFVLQHVTNQRTMRLWDTQSYVPRAVTEIQKLMGQTNRRPSA